MYILFIVPLVLVIASYVMLHLFKRQKVVMTEPFNYDLIEEKPSKAKEHKTKSSNKQKENRLAKKATKDQELVPQSQGKPEVSVKPKTSSKGKKTSVVPPKASQPVKKLSLDVFIPDEEEVIEDTWIEAVPKNAKKKSANAKKQAMDEQEQPPVSSPEQTPPIPAEVADVSKAKAKPVRAKPSPKSKAKVAPEPVDHVKVEPSSHPPPVKRAPINAEEEKVASVPAMQTNLLSKDILNERDALRTQVNIMQTELVSNIQSLNESRQRAEALERRVKELEAVKVSPSQVHSNAKSYEIDRQAIAQQLKQAEQDLHKTRNLLSAVQPSRPARSTEAEESRRRNAPDPVVVQTLQNEIQRLAKELTLSTQHSQSVEVQLTFANKKLAAAEAQLKAVSQDTNNNDTRSPDAPGAPPCKSDSVELKQLAKEKQELTARLAEAKQDLDRHAAAHKLAQEELDKQLAAAHDQLNSAKNSLAEMQQEIARAHALLATKDKELAQAHQELQRAQSTGREVNGDTADHQALQEQLALQENKLRLTEQRCADLQAAADRMAAVEAQLKESNAKYDSLQRLQSKTMEQLASVKAQMQAKAAPSPAKEISVEVERNSAELERLRKQNTAFEQQLRDTDQQLSKLLVAANEETEAWRKKLLEKEKLFNESQDRLKQLSSELAAIKSTQSPGNHTISHNKVNQNGVTNGAAAEEEEAETGKIPLLQSRLTKEIESNVLMRSQIEQLTELICEAEKTVREEQVISESLRAKLRELTLNQL